jgi:hypothetical protein
VQKGDASGAIRVVFDGLDDRRDAVFTAFEIDAAVHPAGTASAMVSSDATLVIPTATFLKRFKQRFLGLVGGYLFKRRANRIPCAGGYWSQIFEGHIVLFSLLYAMESWRQLLEGQLLQTLNQIDPITLPEGYHGFLYVGPFFDSRTVTLLFAPIHGDVYTEDSNIEVLFDSLLHQRFVGFRGDLESVLALFLKQRAFFSDGGTQKN